MTFRDYAYWFFAIAMGLFAVFYNITTVITYVGGMSTPLLIVRIISGTLFGLLTFWLVQLALGN